MFQYPLVQGHDDVVLVGAVEVLRLQINGGPADRAEVDLI